MADLAFRSATALAAALQRREVGSRELLEHYVQRVELLNPRLNAVVTLDLERARRRADAADAALTRGELWGALHGLPMTVKDALETAAVRTTSGARMYADHVPSEDATAVRRVLAAGAVIFGKTNLPALAMDVQTYNPVFGTTNNPWDVQRSPGGSSGGAAAALAAGLTALEIGSDIAGSIRNPAHYCGVYGLKPTHGIIPSRGHIPGPPGMLTEPDIGVVGPLGRAAEDLELGLNVLAGPEADAAVAWTLNLPAPRHRTLRDYRVGVWLDDPECVLDAAVHERLQATVDAVRRAGATVDEQARPGFALVDAFRDYLRLLHSATNAGAPVERFKQMIGLAKTLPDDDSFLSRWARFGTMRHREWLMADEKRARYRVQWAAFFRKYDVLLCPITPVAAIPHDHSDALARTIVVNGQPRPYWDQIIWAGVIGMSFLPAVVAPTGLTASRLPVGIQVVGPYLEDRTPIAFARLLAEVAGGFVPPPGYEL